MLNGLHFVTHIGLSWIIASLGRPNFAVMAITLIGVTAIAPHPPPRPARSRPAPAPCA